MKNTTPQPSPTALSVRRFRERLRDQGLVKKEVWILPEHAAALAGIEMRMREAGSTGGALGPAPETRVEAWTLDTLMGALLEASMVKAGHMSIERMEGAEPTLLLTMHQHGDLSVLLAVGSEQILVETSLWPESAVREPQAFNAVALQTHKYLPLSNFSLGQVGDEPGYTLFGALDTRSGLDSVLLEIQAIADNAITAVDMYSEFLTEQSA